MNIIKFKKDYFLQFENLINNPKLDQDIKILIKKITKVKKTSGTIHLFGNGGSHATASHFANDMTKNAKIKSVVYSDSALTTCYNNDYGFENALYKIAEKFVNFRKDLIIILSVSGNSKNLVNLVKFCIKKKINFISLTGSKKNNRINNISKKKNIWVDSKAYNIVEIIHHYLLLMSIDYFIGSTVYKIDK
tara:strand:+ start:400 stop:972 length:573 start_codon:yes stop_codon:yes gene_type:complete